MPRLLFEKKGEAVWISHLDLMRMFQRAFKRAGLPLKHTQGFNPRPSVSIALPLSVGVESCCELLDFELDGASVSDEEITKRLNPVLVSGVKVLKTYDSGRKIRDLSILHCHVTLEYDSGVPECAVTALQELFSRDVLPVVKKTKSGPQEQDIIPMIRRLGISQISGRELLLDGWICCQNPTLNPAQLCGAISRYMPLLTPDFSRCVRIEVYDNKDTIFR